MTAFQNLVFKVKNSELLFHTVISISVRILAALATFLASIVLGRYLGVEGAGYYFLAFSIVAVLSAVSRAGLDNTIIRFIGAAAPDKQWGRVSSVLNRSLVISLSLSCAASIAVFFCSSWLANNIFGKPDLAFVLRSMAPSIIGLSLLTLISMSLQGLRKIISSILTLNVIANTFLTLGIILFVITQPENAALLYSGASLFAALLGYFIFKVSISSGAGSVEWSELLQSCMPLWIVVIMGQLVQYSGQFIAGAWVSPEDVAQLAVAQRTALLTSFILMAVNMVVAPRFASMYEKKEFIELQSLALTSVKLMVLFALPVVLCMLLFPSYILMLFGEGFSEGAVYLQILAVGQFINVATGSVGFLLSMSGHEKDLRNTVLISGPVALVLALTLTPLFGATGAAIATAIAVATQNLIAVWWVKKRLGFNTLAVWR
ncbi:oligosaccharide flippase family protein [Amphritea pacifica]|uniref:Oligosaccharide flippase family protein n=1 Tax=Amphritea pacifica TaxID=2811233 RepID=A0ABS2W808_9GAMM|nr:oligosaccharide flippase family protein [Amphritea pacifica]MBN0987761.1 oligosaccharide flippase family protein [Amphritea pacifica]